MTFSELVEIYNQRLRSLFGGGDSNPVEPDTEPDKLNSLIDGLSTATTVKEIRAVANNLKDGETNG